MTEEILRRSGSPGSARRRPHVGVSFKGENKDMRAVGKRLGATQSSKVRYARRETVYASQPSSSDRITARIFGLRITTASLPMCLRSRKVSQPPSLGGHCECRSLGLGPASCLKSQYRSRILASNICAQALTRARSEGGLGSRKNPGAAAHAIPIMRRHWRSWRLLTLISGLGPGKTRMR